MFDVRIPVRMTVTGRRLVDTCLNAESACARVRHVPHDSGGTGIPKDGLIIHRLTAEGEVEGERLRWSEESNDRH